MTLYHQGELVGEVITNRSLTIEEACELLNIDINETDSAGDPVWNYDSFVMIY